MRNRIHYLLFLVLCLFVTSLGLTQVWADSVNEIKIITESNPPQNFEKDGKLQGISVDLMGLMLKKVNSKLNVSDIQLLPWARGYAELQANKNTCLFSTARTAERENLFKWVGPIITVKVVLMAKKDRHIVINSADDLKKYHIGVIIGDVSESLLSNLGFDKSQLDSIGGVDPGIQNIKKLVNNRIDLFARSELAIRSEIKQLNLNQEDFEPVYTLREGKNYYAFNKDTDDVIIKQLQDALDALVKSGEYQKVADKYIGK